MELWSKSLMIITGISTILLVGWILNVEEEEIDKNKNNKKKNSQEIINLMENDIKQIINVIQALKKNINNEDNFSLDIQLKVWEEQLMQFQLQIDDLQTEDLFLKEQKKKLTQKIQNELKEIDQLKLLFENKSLEEEEELIFN